MSIYGVGRKITGTICDVPARNPDGYNTIPRNTAQNQLTTRVVVSWHLLQKATSEKKRVLEALIAEFVLDEPNRRTTTTLAQRRSGPARLPMGAAPSLALSPNVRAPGEFTCQS